MSRRRAAAVVLLALARLAAAAGVWLWCGKTGPVRAGGSVDAPPAVGSGQHRDRRGGSNVTLLALSDTRVGFAPRQLRSDLMRSE